MQNAKVIATWVAAVLLTGGCLGQGTGWVTGGMWVDNCRDGEPLGESQDKLGEFDLHADFFSGEIQEDSNKSDIQRENRLTVRIQNTSNNVEVSDGLLLQMNDLDLAARNFASREPVPIGASGVCPGGSCAVVEDPLRGTLYLHASCPECHQPLVGTTHELEPSSADPSCQVATGSLGEACPTLTTEGRDALEELCNGDFADRSAYDVIGQSLGGGACMYFCHLGEARRDQSPQELEGFRVEYGDRIAAIFVMNIVDARAINLQACARAAGEIRGMFDFEVVRGRAAQSFP